MPDHSPGLQHSSVVFYLKPDSANGAKSCDDCGRFACVKLIDIHEGSITLENFFCQMCYLCHLTLTSCNMYGLISTECGKALCMSGGLPVNDCAKEAVSIPDATGYSPDPHFPPQDFHPRIVEFSDEVLDVSHKSTAPTTTTIYVLIKAFFARSRRSRTAKGRT